jgi:K+-sensing histidine kinase KdpD
MARFVDGLLDLGQIESDALVLRSSAQDVESLVREAIELVQPEAKPRIVATIATDRKVLCDRARLLHVLFNLLNNAAKFAANSDEIRVGVEAAEEGLSRPKPGKRSACPRQ